MPDHSTLPAKVSASWQAIRQIRQWLHRLWLRLATPLGCLALATWAAVLCALTSETQVWLLVVVLGMLTAGAVLWPMLVLRGVRCRIDFPEQRGREGQPAKVRLLLENRWHWPVWGLFVEGGFTQSDASADEKANTSQADVALAVLPARSRCEVLWSFVPQRRGVYPAHEPSLATGFPFGLFIARRPVSVASPLLIWPRSTPLTGLPWAGSQGHSGESLSDERIGDTGDLLGARPFRRGDSFRRIHWPLTARHNQLITTERQATSRALVELILDNVAPEQTTDDTESRWNQALRVTASIAEHLHREHVHVAFHCGDFALNVRPGGTLPWEVLDALAQAEPQDNSRPAGLPGSGVTYRIVVTTSARSELPTTSSLANVETLTIRIAGKSGAANSGEILLSDSGDLFATFSSQWERAADAAWCGTHQHL